MPKVSQNFKAKEEILRNSWPFIEVIFYQCSFQSDVLHFLRIQIPMSHVPALPRREGPLQLLAALIGNVTEHMYVASKLDLGKIKKHM